MERKVLSILGCGWLGKAVAERFISEGWNVKGSTTSPEKFATLTAMGIDPYLVRMDPHPAGDRLDNFLDADILLVSIPPRRKAGLTAVYLEQIKSLSEALANATVKRVIFISSTSIYQDLNRTVVEGDADPSSYLFLAENFLLTNLSFKTTVLRFGGLIGGDRHPGRFLAGKQNVDGATTPVNMIHQQDCVAIIFQIVVQNVFGEVFNACADLHPTKKEFYEAAGEALDLSPPTFSEAIDSPFKIVSAEKLKSALKYQFSFPDPMGMV